MMKKFEKKDIERGFTYIEAILYVSIVSVMLAAIIPFAWDIIEGGSQSAVQQEVSSNTRYISERIKYEIRNATALNSSNCAAASKTFSLANSTSALNPTIITFTSPNVTIRQGAGATINLNSNDVVITNFTCTHNVSADNRTKNLSVGFTVQQAYTGPRADFKFSMPVSVSAELRTN